MLTGNKPRAWIIFSANDRSWFYDDSLCLFLLAASATVYLSLLKPHLGLEARKSGPPADRWQLYGVSDFRKGCLASDNEQFQ